MRTGWWNTAWRVLALAMILCLAGLSHAGAQLRQVDGPFIPLAGVHEFRISDEQPWQPVVLPGLWQGHGVSAFAEQGWYRIRFVTPPEFDSKNPVFVAYLLGQDQVLLNGQQIGGSRPFTLPGQGLRPFVPHGVLRAYAIPAGLLKNDEQNTLVIRMNRAMLLENGGIADFIFGIADHHQVLAARTHADQRIWMLDGVFLSANLMMLFIAIIARLMGITHPVVRTALKVTFAMSIAAWAGSHGYLGLDTGGAWLSGLALICGFAVLAFNVEFVSISLDVKVRRASVVLQMLLLFCIIPSGLLPFAIPESLRVGATIVALIGMAGSIAWLIGVGVAAARHGDNFGWVFCFVYLVLVAVPFAWGILDAELSVAVGVMTGRPSFIIGVQIVTLILAGVFAHRTFRFERESLRANDRALRAQEAERRRLARDMHDSVGQWLGSIKMRLQALSQKGAVDHQGDSYRELLGDMDVLITDTRRIAHDLTAISVARDGLKAAIRAHLAAVEEDFGVAGTLAYPDDLDMSERAADHLYRIIQEATANAVNHGGATEISVVFSSQDGRLLLAIRDNGKGFDTAQRLDGFGLASIRDRAAMLRGLARVTSSSQTGTEIWISVPEHSLHPADEN